MHLRAQPYRPLPLAAASLLLVAATLAGAARGEPIVCGSVADEFAARAAGLERQWILQLPSGVGSARLERVTVGADLVVAQTGDGGLHAIQAARVADAARPGTVLWSQQVGTPGGPTGAAGIGSEVVAVASDLAITAVDRRTGSIIWREDLGHLPGSSAVPAGDWVYAAVPNQGVLRLAANPWRSSASPTPAGAGKPAAGRGQPAAAATFIESPEPRTINAGGDVDFAPVPVADGVAWSTSDGTFVALERTKQGWVRHELPLAAPLAGQPVARGRSLFVATGPFRSPWPATLARIELADPAAKDKAVPGLAVAWRVALPDHPEDGPLVAGDLVLISLGPSGIAACSAATGELLWRSDVMGRLLAAGGDRMWCIDQVGRLTALDLASGSPRARLCLAGLSLPVVNTATDALVLAAPGGVIMSFAPAQQPPAADPASLRQ